MKVKKSLFLLSVLFCAAFAQNKPKIAVYVSEHSGYSQEVLSALRTATLTAIVKSRQYEVVERSGVIDEELSRQTSGAIDDDQLTAFGRQAGARYICVSDMVPSFITTREGTRYKTCYDGKGNQYRCPEKYTRTYNDFQVSARIIDVETAQVIAMGVTNATDDLVTDPKRELPDEYNPLLSNVVNKVVTKMLGSVQDKTEPSMPKMAVYIQGGRANQNEGKALYTYVLNALFTRARYNDEFKVVERSDAFTRQIDREQLKQHGGDVDNAQITRMGKQYGIERILVANIDYAMNTYNISARIVNVETAGIVDASELYNSKNANDNLDEIRRIAVSVVDDMIKRKKTAAEIKAEQAEIEADREAELAEIEAQQEAEQTGWYVMPKFGGGLNLMVNNIDTLYESTGWHVLFGAEFFKANIDFLRFGFKFDLGMIASDDDNVKKREPEADSMGIGPGLFKLDAFVKLSIADILYLFGGTGVGYYGSYDVYYTDSKGDKDTKSGPTRLAPEFSFGGGLLLANYFFIEAQYHLVQFNDAQYLSINAGFTSKILMGDSERQAERRKREAEKRKREMEKEYNKM